MKFDTTKYKVWTWKNPLMLHWIINPGLAFNELILGQRIPKVTLIEKGSIDTLAERTFVPCPHCNTIHSGLKWTPQNNTAFKNWYGYYCDHCGKIIPCLRNLTSFILLAITFPIWTWFNKTAKEKWMAQQKIKFSKPLVLQQPEFSWWYVGLRYALIMFIVMSIFKFLIHQEKFTWLKLLLYAVAWLIGGMIYGLTMKMFASKKRRELQENSN